jgi:ATP-dependent RNA helicase DeaD
MNTRREEEFFAKIEEGLKGDLGDYRKALQRLIEESGHDTIDVAASLAFLEAGKKGLRYEDMPIPPRKPKRDREDRPDRQDRFPKQGGRDDRRSAKDDHLQSYRLEIGEYHGAQKGDIVGAIANEVGIDPKSMGKIRMFKDHTFIDLPKDMPREIFEALKAVWVQGHQLNISIDKGRPRPEQGGRSGKGFDKRNKFGKGSKGGKKGFSSGRFRT